MDSSDPQRQKREEAQRVQRQRMEDDQKRLSRDSRDLDRDGDVDLADDPTRDLDRDGRIDADDRKQNDLDHDNDIDANDRSLKNKNQSVREKLSEQGYEVKQAAPKQGLGQRMS